jgi:hypothetical protein
VEYATQTPGGVINTARTATGATRRAPEPAGVRAQRRLYRLDRGPVFGNLMINSSSNHVATPIAQWNLKQPLEQVASMGKATYDLNDDTSVWVQASYAWSNVFTLSQYHQTPTVTILATNPYLPAATRAFMQANNLASFDMGRVDTEWLGDLGRQHLQDLRGLDRDQGQGLRPVHVGPLVQLRPLGHRLEGLRHTGGQSRRRGIRDHRRHRRCRLRPGRIEPELRRGASEQHHPARIGPAGLYAAEPVRDRRLIAGGARLCRRPGAHQGRHQAPRPGPQPVWNPVQPTRRPDRVRHGP